jgi:predicted Zn-dependent protease
VCKSRPVAAFFACIITVLAVVMPAPAKAQQFIRDAEIEATIRDYARPIFKAADLNADAIDVFLIADKNLNAFVAGGMNMFLHTGLLQRADGPLQVMGVIAHEAGHIAGGHIAGRRQQVRETTPQVIASYVLGLAAAIATGRSDAGLAVAAGGQGAVLSSLLSYTRGQEGAADQAGVSYLNQAGYSPKGLLEFMEILEGQEALLSNNQDPYLRTHPLTRDRINFLKEAVSQSPHSDQGAPTRLRLQHERMVAKLDGFLQAPRETLRDYADDESLSGRYARTIAHYQNADLDKAVSMIDALIAEYPDDPYFHELKGQMLYEHGRIADSLPPYREAVSLEPESALLKLGLARAQVQLNDPDLNAPALDNLEYVLDKEPRNAAAWRLRAIAHGRAGDRGMTAWALAEGRLAQGKLREAIDQSRRALSLLQKHSPHWLRAQDIRHEAERRLDKQKEG